MKINFNIASDVNIADIVAQSLNGLIVQPGDTVTLSFTNVPVPSPAPTPVTETEAQPPSS